MYNKNFSYFLIFFTIIITGCNNNPTRSERPPVPVTSAKAISHDVQEYAEAVGCCRSHASVDIVPEVFGTLKNIHFSQGAHVKEGDLLYTIDPTRYEAALNQAKAKLAQAEAQLRIDSAKLERSKSLLPQNYISQQEYETVEAQVIQDKAAVEAAKAVIEQANLDLKHCFITSPINGIAGKYNIDAGNVLPQTSLSQLILVNIQDVDHLYVDFAISENRFSELYKSFCQSSGELDVNVHLVANESIQGAAKLHFIENTINKQTGSINLRALLENNDHKFWPGSTVNVKILLKTNKNAVLVPSESVRLGQNGRYVFVIKDDKTAELRTVKIGQEYGDFVVIKDGVLAGETVVRSGQLMLAPGAKIIEVPDQRQNQFKTNLQLDKEMAEKNPTTR